MYGYILSIWVLLDDEAPEETRILRYMLFDVLLCICTGMYLDTSISLGCTSRVPLVHPLGTSQG